AVGRSGGVHWTLARPDVLRPRWVGTRTDTRIAYFTAGRLHLVAGDGTGDAAAAAPPARAAVAPAWRPGPQRVVAYVDTRGSVVLYDAARASLLWRSRPFQSPHQLTWSDDGRLLPLVAGDDVVVFHGTRPAV